MECSVDFDRALALASVGYRMRYQDWPEGDYIVKRSGGNLYRFHSTFDGKPYEVLPWITSEMMQGKWYFAQRARSKR